MRLLRLLLSIATATITLVRPAVAQSAHQHSHQMGDTAFAAMQGRGKVAMGVDQYTSQHHFVDLSDGGRIVLQRDSSDSGGTRTIREHLRGIARAFAAGDFATPGFVHSEQVPGTDTMRAKRTRIHYRFQPLAGGGEVRITSHDSTAIAAIHQFLAYQRREHRTK
jgi:hypothetical protein